MVTGPVGSFPFLIVKEEQGKDIFAKGPVNKKAKSAARYDMIVITYNITYNRAGLLENRTRLLGSIPKETLLPRHEPVRSMRVPIGV